MDPEKVELVLLKGNGLDQFVEYVAKTEMGTSGDIYPKFCCRCGVGFWAIVDWASVCDACDKAIIEAEEDPGYEILEGR